LVSCFPLTRITKSEKARNSSHFHEVQFDRCRPVRRSRIGSLLRRYQRRYRRNSESKQEQKEGELAKYCYDVPHMLI
jgi:hypothetical protein